MELEFLRRKYVYGCKTKEKHENIDKIVEAL